MDEGSSSNWLTVLLRTGYLRITGTMQDPRCGFIFYRFRDSLRLEAGTDGRVCESMRR
jgi:hypothetical protein